MPKITEDDLFDAIADDICRQYPQPGEETVELFMLRMKKRGRVLTDDQASYWLDKQVASGKLKRRMGIVNGKVGRIYSKA